MTQNQLPITTEKFRPATPEQALQALALLAALPTMTPQTDEEMQLRKEAYLIALEGVSAWGLAEATKAILKGSLGHRWFPSPAELYIEIQRVENNERERFYRAERQRRQFFWDEDQHPRPVEEKLLKDDPEGRERMHQLWIEVRKSLRSFEDEKLARMTENEQHDYLKGKFAEEDAKWRDPELILQRMAEEANEKIHISETLLRRLKNPMR